MSDIHHKRRFITVIAGQHGRRLQRYLAARLRNAADAPDMAQEVYLRLLRLQKHELVRNPEAYLLTIANHLLGEHHLRQASLPPMIELEDLAAEVGPLTQDDTALQVDALRRVEDLERALEGLSAKARAALILHRRDGFSIEEIGVRIGVSRNVAKKYLAKALKYCRKQLAQDDSTEAER